MMKDIQPILADWEFIPNNISVRKIEGVDGSTKIQLRLAPIQNSRSTRMIALNYSASVFNIIIAT